MGGGRPPGACDPGAELILDHLVLTVRDIEATVAWYRDVLGLGAVTFGEGRRAIQVADRRINLHQAGSEFEPKAARPTPGSGDLCFVTETPLADVLAELRARSVAIVEGPVPREGACGPLESIYVRDPDENLVEISNRSPSPT